MITQPTVFILGAGASQPFGFPTGEELHRKICTREFSLPHGMNTTQRDELENQITQFQTAFRDSGKISVDAFLEHRVDLIKIGKFVIACILAPLEKHNWLFVRQSKDKKDTNWYKYVFAKMSSSKEAFGKNQISFVTFNYDRSLEHFLHTSVKNSFDLTNAGADEILKSIPIIHLHGSLGEYDPANGYGTMYIPIDINGITAAADAIKVIHEDDLADTNPKFVHARDLISKAEHVITLGFGFHEKNIQRLHLTDMPKHKNFLATGYGLKQLEKAQIESMLSSNGDHRIDALGAPHWDSLEFLRERVTLQ